MCAGIVERGHRACFLFALLFWLGSVPADSQDQKLTQPNGPPGHTAGLPDLIDLQNHAVDPFRPSAAKAIVFIFVRTDCPISNRYAPEIMRLYQRYTPKGFAFWLVYPDPDVTPEEITRHLKEYRLPPVALRDPHFVLVKRAGVRVTPEVAVFFPDGREVYRGRIDDRVVDFGKERPAPAQHDLNEVLGSVLEGKTVTNQYTQAVGCYLSNTP
jgi:hypothetical protein